MNIKASLLHQLDKPNQVIVPFKVVLQDNDSNFCFKFYILEGEEHKEI